MSNFSLATRDDAGGLPPQRSGGESSKEKSVPTRSGPRSEVSGHALRQLNVHVLVCPCTQCPGTSLAPEPPSRRLVPMEGSLYLEALTKW